MPFWKKNKQPKDSFSTLHDAVEAGDIAAVKRLLQAGADVKEVDGRGAPPLQIAAARGHLEIAKVLVENGADINYLIDDGGTPLMGAAACLKPKLIDFLLSKGAQPNKKGVDGRFPLICSFQPAVAAVDKQIECIRLLVSAGARIDERTDSGDTPLMTAAWFGNMEAVKELVRLGANPTLKDREGKTAAITAFERGYDDIAKLLKEASDRASTL